MWEYDTLGRVVGEISEDECEHLHTHVVHAVSSNVGAVWVASGYVQSEGIYCSDCGKRISD